MARRAFGNVRKLPSGRWQAGYWHEGARHTADHTFTAKADATSWLSTVETDILRGAWIDPAGGRTTFREYAERWRALQVHRPSTATQVETNLRRHVYPRLGNKPLVALRTSDIRTLVKELSATLAPATVEVVYTWVATILRAAVADRVIAVSPCSREIKRPRVERAKVRPLETEKVAALAEAVPARYRAMIWLGAGTGVRIGEGLGLTEDRIGWLKREVVVDRQLVGVDEDGAPTFGPLKDRYNRPRTIPVPDTLLEVLSAQIATYGTGAEGLIFTTASGGPVRRSLFADIWRKAADPLGIPTGDGYHQLRHFYASTLIGAGQSVKVVQDRLGHASAAMTLDVYAHLLSSDEEGTRAATETALGTLRARSAHAKGA